MLEVKQIPKKVMNDFWKEYEELTKDKFDELENWRLESILHASKIILD